MTFSLVNVLLIRPLPYPDPDRLVVLWQSEKESTGFDLTPTSPANFVDWQERSTSFEEMAAL
jgi:putative ABC transport system permease protein